jgi:hypothetical protein
MTAKQDQVALHTERFPGESADYRKARNKLLQYPSPQPSPTRGEGVYSACDCYGPLISI